MALTYVANKFGMDVVDLRGGDSRKYFSMQENILKLAELPGVISHIDRNPNEIDGTMNILRKFARDRNKEYILSTGEHTAIVRKAERGWEHLVLTDDISNGFRRLTRDELQTKFSCVKNRRNPAYRIILIEADSLANNENFRFIMGYIDNPNRK